MRKGREVFTTSGTYPWSFVTQIFHNGQPSRGGNRKIFEVMTSTLPRGTLGSVASLLATTLYQGNPDRNHKLWNILSERANFIFYFQNNFLVSDDGEGKVFIIFFYEISDFPEPSEQFFFNLIIQSNEM